VRFWHGETEYIAERINILDEGGTCKKNNSTDAWGTMELLANLSGLAYIKVNALITEDCEKAKKTWYLKL